MLDPTDYKEPRCATCGGKGILLPDKNAPAERIPVDRIIRKLDSLFDKNDMAEAGRLLRNWREEARQLKDKDGELEILSEMMGYYRKTREEERALESVKSGLELIKELNLQGVSAATVTLNAATTLKAFGKAKEALPHYEKALKVYKELLSPDDERLAGLYNNYALALTDLRRYEEAETLYLDALEILKCKNENRFRRNLR